MSEHAVGEVAGTDQGAAAGVSGSIDELAAELSEQGVRIVRVIHADLFGKARSKQFPVSALPSLAGGVGYCKASIVESIGGVPLEGGGFPADLGYPDIQSLPDMRSTRVVPWEPDTAWIMADLTEAGAPSELCCRSALRIACERLAGVGLEAIVAAEPEFYLLRETETGPEPYSPGVGMAYTAGRRADPTGILGRLHRQLIELGIHVTAANREFSPGQFELNLHHELALVAGDNAFLLKEAIKELALDEGLFATFMAMPFGEHAGSSCHLHVSLWEDGRNIFTTDSGLSERCEHFIGGILEHSQALTAFASPTVNSYKRTAAGGLAPTTAGSAATIARPTCAAERARGRDQGRAARRRAAANPYLLTAVTLYAGLDGIERELAPTPCAGCRSASTRRSPRSRPTRCCARGSVAELVRVYVALKRRRVGAVRQRGHRLGVGRVCLPGSELGGYTAPRSPEGRAGLVPPPPWHYVGDMLVIEYWADPRRSRSCSRGRSSRTPIPAAARRCSSTGSRARSTEASCSIRRAASTRSSSSSATACSTARR